MADLYQIWSNDLALNINNGIALATMAEAGRQRVLRRLLTNPGDYFAHPEYGAGLPNKIGTLATTAELQAIVLSQMLQEDAVSSIPEPSVTVTQIVNGVSIFIQYVDAINNEPVTLSFDVNK